MTNETKESLREEFYKKFDADGSGEFCSSEDGDSHSSKSIADFWLEKLDQTLKSQREEIVNKIEVWMPCKQGEGTAIKNDGSQMKLIAMLVGSKVIHLEKDFYIEMAKLNKKEVELLIQNK